MRSNQISRNQVFIWIIGAVIILLLGYLVRGFLGRELSKIVYHFHKHTIKETTSGLPPETEAYIRVLEAENTSLRNTLHTTGDMPISRTAAIITWPSESLDGTFMINAGEKDGVHVGDTVSVSKTLVGTIARTFSGRSIVGPLGTPGQAITVTIAGKDGVYQAAATGFGGFIIQVPKDITIEEGDPVTFPSASGRMIGVVASVDTNNETSFNHVYVTLPVSIFDIRFVTIETVSSI